MVRIPRVIRQIFTSTPASSPTENVDTATSVKHEGRTWKKKTNAYIQKVLIFLHLKRAEKKEGSPPLKGRVVHRHEETPPPDQKDSNFISNLGKSLVGTLKPSKSTATPEDLKELTTALSSLKEKTEKHLEQVKAQNAHIKKLLADESFIKTLDPKDLEFIKTWEEEYDTYTQFSENLHNELSQGLDRLTQDPPNVGEIDSDIKKLENILSNEKFLTIESALFFKSLDMTNFQNKYEDAITKTLKITNLRDFKPSLEVNEWMGQLPKTLKTVAENAEKVPNLKPASGRRLTSIADSLGERSVTLQNFKDTIHPLMEIVKAGQSHVANIENQRKLMKDILKHQPFLAKLKEIDKQFIKDYYTKYSEYCLTCTAIESAISESLKHIHDSPPKIEKVAEDLKKLIKLYKSPEFDHFTGLEDELVLKHASVKDFIERNGLTINDACRELGIPESATITFEPHTPVFQRVTRIALPVSEASKAEAKTPGLMEDPKLAKVHEKLRTRAAKLNDAARVKEFETLLESTPKTLKQRQEKRKELTSLVATLTPQMIVKQDQVEKAIKIAKDDAKDRIKRLKKQLNSKKSMKFSFTIKEDWGILNAYYKNYKGVISEKQYKDLAKAYEEKFPGSKPN